MYKILYEFQSTNSHVPLWFRSKIYIMNFTLCKPAMFYLVVSLIMFITFIVQNTGNTRVYCLGDYECDVNNNVFVLVIQFLYIILFTVVLNMICVYVTPIFSWILVLIIFLVFFISISSLFLFTSKDNVTIYG
jgi:hypothetical protein